MLKLAMMLCIMLAISGCAAKSDVGQETVDPAVAEQVEKYRNHFKRQSLPYIAPLGCSKTVTCSLAADFNDDGIIDFVALYEYSGARRSTSGRFLDLVFVYSVPGSSQPRQQVFTRMGKIDAKNHTAVSLEIQQPGILNLPIGKIELERKGVNLVPADGPPSLFSPTFYWDGEKFYSIVKEAD